jgi:hypothetical protein
MRALALAPRIKCGSLGNLGQRLLNALPKDSSDNVVSYLSTVVYGSLWLGEMLNE